MMGEHDALHVMLLLAGALAAVFVMWIFSALVNASARVITERELLADRRAQEGTDE